MGIDLATWRARIGLYYYRICHPREIKWRSSHGRLYKPGVTSWRAREVIKDTPLMLKSCMAVIALSLILQYIVRTWSELKGSTGGKIRCHWCEATSRVRETVDDGVTLVLSSSMVVVPLLLVMAGDVELNPGPGEQLGIDDLATVRRALFDVRVKWYHIGVELGLPVGTLDAIRTQFTDPTDCVTEMCSKWLKSTHPSPTWDDLIKAVESPIVKEISLAQKLRKTYCQEQEGTLGQPRGTAAQAARKIATQEEKLKNSHPSPKSDDEHTHHSGHSSCKSPPANEMPPFGCGCGKCTFFSFIERGCPKPTPSASSFPYLDLSRLTHEQQQELRGRLRFESQEIMMQFQKLVSATIVSLEKQQIPLTRLVSHLMALGAFDPVYKEGEGQVPAFHHHFKELQTADTVPKVFLALADYFSFFNYHVIEHIITVLGTKEDNDNLQTYKAQFDHYAKRRIYECLSQFGSVSESDHADVFVKVDSQYENYTVTEVERFRWQLSELLHISPRGVLRLCRVEKGCFQLTFQVPSFVQLEVFPLSQEQEKALAEMGVIRLTCGEYQFLAEVNHQFCRY